MRSVQHDDSEKINAYIEKHEKWKVQLAAIRGILRKSGLEDACLFLSLSRMGKAIPLILGGMGLHDKYKNC